MDGEVCNFGEHYMLDGYGGDYDKLNNRELIMRSLTELPDQLGMHRLGDPQILKALDNDIKDPGGWSGFVIIAESHISVHTFPARRFVSIDVYSCKNGMDKEFVKKYFTEIFGIKEMEENFVRRGTRYPVNNVN